MTRLPATAILAALVALPLGAPTEAAEPESCATVRFADVGWTDITATTALAGTVLRGLGYETQVDLLALPVTFQSLARGDIDVFLGNWMPTMETMGQSRGRQVHARGQRQPRRAGPARLRRHRWLRRGTR